MRSLLADILARLDGLTIEPTRLEVDAATTPPIVTIAFARVGDIEAYAATDKARVEVLNKMTPLGHVEHSALYDRPGRRMLLICRVFPHSPDWEDTNA